MAERKLTDFKILEITDDEVSIAFWYDDGEKEIMVVKRDAIDRMTEEIKKMKTVN